jgi:hypothetical protein
MTGIFIKKLMTGVGQAINKVKPKVNTTKLGKATSELNKAIQKNKASQAKLGQTVFEMKNDMPITFKSNRGKSETNKEAYKRIQGENTKVLKGMLDKATENKKDGGRMGLKFGSGTKKKMSNTNVKKKFKNLGNLPESIQIKIAGKKIAKKV